jgi:hypothetical protein
MVIGDRGQAELVQQLRQPLRPAQVAPPMRAS